MLTKLKTELHFFINYLQIREKNILILLLQYTLRRYINLLREELYIL